MIARGFCAIGVLAMIGGMLAGGEPARDAYLAPLPKHAKARLGMVLDRNQASRHVAPALSPDGRLLATAIGERVVVWNLADGTVGQIFQAHPPGYCGLAFLDDDTLLTEGRVRLGAGNSVRAYNLRTKVPSFFFVPDNGSDVVFAPDGSLLAHTVPGDLYELHVWDTRTGKKLFVAKEPFSRVFFSPDGKEVLSSRQVRIPAGGYDAVVTCRDARTGAVARSLTLKNQQTTITDISLDGKTLIGHTRVPGVVQDRCQLQLFDARTGKSLRVLLHEPSGDLRNAVFSRDGKLVAAVDYNENAVSVWETNTGRKRWTFANDRSYVYFPRFSKDGKALVNLTSTGRVFVHNLIAGTTRDFNPTHRGHVMSLAFTPDGKHLASSSHRSEIFLWEVQSGALRNRCEVTSLTKNQPRSFEYALKMAFAPDGKHLLFQQADQVVRLHAPFRGQEVRAFRDAGHVWSFSEDGRHLLWTGAALDLLHRMHNTPRHVAADDGDFWIGQARWVAYAAFYPELRQFRCRAYVSPDLTRELPHAGLLVFPANAPTRRFASAVPIGLSPDGGVLAEWIMRLTGNPFSGMGAYWVRDGIRFSDTATRTQIHRLKVGDTGETVRFQFAPDSRSFAAYGADAERMTLLNLYETRTGKLRLRVSDKPGPHGGIAFSRDGRWLAFVNTQRAIEIFDLAHGKTAAAIPQTDTLHTLAFSPDGGLLATGAEHGVILLWDLKGLLKRAFDEPAWTAADEARLWNDLASADAATAYRAMMRLKRNREAALALLRERLQWPREMRDAGEMVEQLGSASFAARKTATDALERLGERASPYLEDALKRALPLEHRRRIEALLQKSRAPFSTPSDLRLLRALEVLDDLGAADVLRAIAANAPPNDALAREATRALARALARPAGN